MRAGAARLALAALAPVLIAAADPSGDVAGCDGGPGSGAPDLVRAEGRIVEEGTSAVWELTFAAPLRVPDPEGHPFRVDVAIFDPTAPPESFAFYHRINRIVRVDATVAHTTEIYLLPERATNEFNPPIVRGRSMVIQVPGRILTADRDLTGTSPGLGELRWTVIVRDGRSCDVLGDGRPVERLRSAQPVVHEDGTAAASRSAAWLVVLIGVAIGSMAVGYVARRGR
jgi:hypothetical protein